MATTEWHYTINGQPIAAPVSAAQLKQLATSGKLKPTDLVWQDGMLEWAPAASVKGLFPADKNLGDSAAIPVGATVKTTVTRETIKIRPPRNWNEMHPLLVFALTLASGGIFGLIYSWKICQTFSIRSARRKLDAAGRPLGRIRHPFAVLALSYLTLGFYFYYWLYRSLRECNDYLGRKDIQPRTELSLMLIFPPYALYVAAVLLPESIRRAQTLATVPETPRLRYAIFFVNPWLIVALPLLGAICQETLNQMWTTAP